MSTSEDRAAAVTEKSEAHKALVRKAREMKDKGYSNVLIADALGTSESNVRTLLMTDVSDVLPVGAHVEFDEDKESLRQYGVILDHVPLEDGTVAYHIACYHVLSPDLVKETDEHEYAEPWTPETELVNTPTN